MTRILFVDDHPAVRTGLATVLRREPGMVVVGAAGRPTEAVTKVMLTSPDVVLVDYQLPEYDGLVLCQRLKSLTDAPAVLVYSAYADGSLAIAAMVAGAEGLLNKAAPADELIDAIRTVARGGMVLPPSSPSVMKQMGMRLEADDLPILGMTLNGTPRREIAEVLSLSEKELSERTAAIVDRVKTPNAA